MNEAVLKFKLLGDEQVILGNQGALCVTTHRVRFEAQRSGSQAVDEIFLEDLTYQAIRMSSNPLYLVIAALCAVGGLVALLSEPAVGVVFFLVAAVFGLAYIVTRRQVITLASSGGRIELEAKSMPRDTLDWLMYNVAMAKDSRIRNLTARSPMTARAA
jgi:hypothetical protein